MTITRKEYIINTMKEITDETEFWANLITETSDNETNTLAMYSIQDHESAYKYWQNVLDSLDKE